MNIYIYTYRVIFVHVSVMLVTAVYLPFIASFYFPCINCAWHDHRTKLRFGMGELVSCRCILSEIVHLRSPWPWLSCHAYQSGTLDI